MRIISQDGKVDLPYELVSISTHARNSWQVIARPLTNVDGLFCVMGEYSTEEKAVNAMKTLRAEYEKFQETKSINGNYFALVYPKVFRFPQDSDM